MQGNPTCDSVDGDSGFLVEKSPEWARHVEETSLADEDEGDPLVVADVHLSLPSFWNVNLVDRQVVGVLSPTDLKTQRNLSTLHGS